MTGLASDTISAAAPRSLDFVMVFSPLWWVQSRALISPGGPDFLARDVPRVPRGFHRRAALRTRLGRPTICDTGRSGLASHRDQTDVKFRFRRTLAPGWRMR